VSVTRQPATQRQKSSRDDGVEQGAHRNFLDVPAIDHQPARYADLRTPEITRIALRDLLST
jgi:hypothetical protein